MKIVKANILTDIYTSSGSPSLRGEIVEGLLFDNKWLLVPYYYNTPDTFPCSVHIKQEDFKIVEETKPETVKTIEPDTFLKFCSMVKTIEFKP